MHEEAFNAQTFFLSLQSLLGGRKKKQAQQVAENVYKRHPFVYEEKTRMQNIFVFALIFISKLKINTHKNEKLRPAVS